MKRNSKTKRVVVISDLHCGHRFGLVPPAWQLRNNVSVQHKDITKIEKRMWQQYKSLADELSPVDVLFVLGDCVDGKAMRSGSTELITADRNEQVDMACEAIKIWNAPKIRMVHGTPYHVGTEEDWETIVAEKLQSGYSIPRSVTIKDHDWININGVIFDIKHHTGSSSNPYGRHTPLARTRIWNLLHDERKTQPKSKVFLRGHVHYFSKCEDVMWMGATMPSLQAAGTKYGGRLCEGTVDVGVIHFDVEVDGTYAMKPHIFMEAVPVKAEVLV